MISQATAYKIWCAYDEIKSSEALLNQLKDAAKDHALFSIRDAFGKPRGLQLGVPYSAKDSSMRLYDVAPTLAIAVIEAHIANKISELKALNELAKTEIPNFTSETPASA